MGIRHLILLTVVALFSSCKSEYELIRTSNNPERIYSAAEKYYKEKDYDKAIGLYDIIIQYYRGRQEAEELFYNYAWCHYNTGDYILSATYFKNHSTTFTNSNKREEMEFMAAMSNYKLSPNHKLDQSYSLKAIESFEQFINLFPDSERVPEAIKYLDKLREKLELKSYEQGILYYRIGQYQSAITSFQIFLKDFPETKKMEEIRFLMIKSAVILAENSIYEKQEERWNEALSFYQQFQKKFPKSKLMKEARSMEKDILKAIKQFKK
jgi:outer membrane protein assembly factor BamD